MLLIPVLRRVGLNAINLSGDEIKKHETLKGQRIKYGYREGDINHVDILVEGKDLRTTFQSGIYS